MCAVKVAVAWVERAWRSSADPGCNGDWTASSCSSCDSSRAEERRSRWEQLGMGRSGRGSAEAHCRSILRRIPRRHTLMGPRRSRPRRQVVRVEGRAEVRLRGDCGQRSSRDASASCDCRL